MSSFTVPTPVSDAAAVSSSGGVLPPRRLTRLTSRMSDVGFTQHNNQGNKSTLLPGAPTPSRKSRRAARVKSRVASNNQRDEPPLSGGKSRIEATVQGVDGGGQRGDAESSQVGTNASISKPSTTSFWPNLSSFKQAERPSGYSASARNDESTTTPMARRTASEHGNGSGKISNPQEHQQKGEERMRTVPGSYSNSPISSPVVSIPSVIKPNESVITSIIERLNHFECHDHEFDHMTDWPLNLFF